MLEEGGLVARDSDKIRPLVRLVPYAGVWVACDIVPSHQDSFADFVMGVGASSDSLVRHTIDFPVRRYLDLGAGSGVQGLLMGRRGAAVTAVDRNDRALAFARFNAELNGLAQTEHFQGDLFDPVAQRRFDLITFNAPYVVSPDFQGHYRDAGMPLDSFCLQVANEAPQCIEEGGCFQMLCHWVHTTGESWEERLRERISPPNCDVWVLRMATHAPGEYAISWLPRDGQTVGPRYDRWMTYYERNRVEAICSGLITIRRRSAGSNWFRVTDAPDVSVGSLGGDIRRAIESFDVLENLGRDGISQMRLKLNRDVIFDQSSCPGVEGWEPRSSTIRRETGFCYAVSLSQQIASGLVNLDGQRTVGETIAATGRELNSQELFDVLPQLIEHGVVIPVGIDGNT